MSDLWNKVKQGASSYINLYNPVSKTEGFDGTFSAVSSLIWLVMVCFALYLSYRHQGHFDLIHAVFAFCCPPVYILYIFTMTGGKGLF